MSAATPRARLLASVDPHVVLAGAAAIAVAAEAGYRTWTSVGWLLLQASVAGAALVYAWLRQDALRLAPLLAIGAAFHLAWIGTHVALDVAGDIDSRLVYRWQGNAILNGYYPRSEYPAGAVFLFAFEAWVGGGTTRVANALAMVPFQLACVVAVWLCRTRWSAWLAALVALWPMNAFSWEFKYDLVPAALIAVGAVLALRDRWLLAGVVLGVGTAAKWTPALTLVALVVWLLAARRTREAIVAAGAWAGAVAVVYLPALVWDAEAASAAYTRQGGRAITPESVWWLPLRPLGLASMGRHISFPAADVPGWADTVAIVLQAALVLAVLAAAARVRGRPAAVAVAAVAPCVFLLTNRIFSPQFMVVVLVATAVAAALVVRTRGEQLAVGVALMAATTANAFVYPFALPYYAQTWQVCSALLFVVALALCGWLVLRAAGEPSSAAAAS